MTSRPRILIVDDINTNIRILAKSVEDLGEVISASSGQEALELFDQQRPALVLLDIMMPEMDGYEVLAALRERSGADLPPVIFVTARDDTEAETQALSHGAVDFITKPVNPYIVRSRVKVHLELAMRSRELKRLNDSLEHRVEERTSALRIALERAEAATRSHSQFLRNISHELLTPLNAILGFTNLLRIKRGGDTELVSRLDPIMESAFHLQDMINQLLQIAGQDSTQQSPEPFRIHSMLNALQKHGLAACQKSGLTLVMDVDLTIPDTVMGLPDNLRHIMSHLLDNAVKFSETGTVTVRAEIIDRHDDHLNLRMGVLDEGIGIDPTSREHVFALFEQGDASSTRKHGGLGIGLPTCQFLAQQMGAEIHFDSEPGKGSHFWLDVSVGLPA